MEEKNNNNGLVILVSILSVLVLALGGFIIYDKVLSKKELPADNKPVETKNNDAIDNKKIEIKSEDTIKELNNSISIKELTFDKPTAGGIGGEPYTLSTNMTVYLECSNDSVEGIRINGYCLDENNKYLFEGPSAVSSFNCNNSDNKLILEANQLYKKGDNKYYKIPEKTSDIKWEEVEITYCKFDKANIILKDGSEINTKIDINYEKSFK